MITEPNLLALEYICLNLRECDAREIYGLMPFEDNPLVLARVADELFRNRGRSRIAWHDGKPAGIIGITEARPGVWDMSMFGTDDFKAVAFELLRWIRSEIPDILETCKGHRLQADSRSDHEEAHKMLRALGAVQEGPAMRAYGKDKGDYIRFVWWLGENDAFIRKEA